MQRNGNTVSNRIYNPQNKKPAIPLDVDEIDSAMERYIRQKYEQGTFSGKSVQLSVRHDTGSTGSSEEQPPPLPPKPTRRFGFGLRAASSTFPISRHARDKEHIPAPDVNSYTSPTSEIQTNKQSRVFGATLGDANNTEFKLATLRDMGFPDDKRNLNVLKGLGGNLERAIESLVRLGEGTAARPRSRSTQERVANLDEPVRSVSPLNNPPSRPRFAKSEANPGTSDRIQGRSNQQNAGQSQITTNLTFASTGISQTSPYSPFETALPHSSIFPLESAFEGLPVSQPLFPNATGGYPSQQQQIQEARFQQSMTPPVPQLPHQHVYINPIMQSHNGSFNPFLQQSHQPPLSAPTNFLSPFAQQHGSANPYTNSLSNNLQSQQTPQSAPPQQQQYLFHNVNALNQQTTTPQYQHYSDPNILQTQQYPQFIQPSEPQALLPQPTGRMDKKSILNLYNYPQLAPPPPTNYFGTVADAQTPVNETPAPDVHAKPVSIPGQRSVTMPARLSAGSKNPFHTNQAMLVTTANADAANGDGSRHVSQDSTDYSRESQGRSSPDAFATLSSRFVR